MSSSAEDLCGHCKQQHSLASCPELEQQQQQQYSQVETNTSPDTAGVELHHGSATMQTMGAVPASPMEGLTYNGGAYLCADTHTAMLDSNNNHAGGNGSSAPSNPYANTYPATLGSSDLSTAVGNRFNWADCRSTSAASVSRGAPVNGSIVKGNNDNNNDFNEQSSFQPNDGIESPVKQEQIPSSPPIPHQRVMSNNSTHDFPGPSHFSATEANSSQGDFQPNLASFSVGPATSTTGDSSGNGHVRPADWNASAQYGGVSTSEFRNSSTSVAEDAPGMIPRPINSYTPSSHRGEYFRPSNVINDQRSVPGQYRYTGYANDPAKVTSAGSYGQPVNVNPAPAGLRLPYDVFIHERIGYQNAMNALRQASGGDNSAAQQRIPSGPNEILAMANNVFDMNHIQPASPIQQTFNVRPMPKQPHMADYKHTPTFAVECLKNYANDLQSWAFELSLHSTRLENLMDLPGQLIWNKDEPFEAKLILDSTPANRELFKASMAAGNAATKVMIRRRRAEAAMNSSPLNFQAAGQQPVGSILGTENDTSDGTPKRGNGRGRGRAGAGRGGRSNPAAKKAPTKRKSITQDIEDGEDMMGGDSTGFSATMSTAANKAPGRKRGPAKKVKSEPASDTVDGPAHSPGFRSFPMLAAKAPGIVDDRDVDAEGETDEEWLGLQRRISLVLE